MGLSWEARSPKKRDKCVKRLLATRTQCHYSTLVLELSSDMVYSAGTCSRLLLYLIYFFDLFFFTDHQADKEAEKPQLLICFPFYFLTSCHSALARIIVSPPVAVILWHVCFLWRWMKGYSLFRIIEKKKSWSVSFQCFSKKKPKIKKIN